MILPPRLFDVLESASRSARELGTHAGPEWLTAAACVAAAVLLGRSARQAGPFRPVLLLVALFALAAGVAIPAPAGGWLQPVAGLVAAAALLPLFRLLPRAVAALEVAPSARDMEQLRLLEAAVAASGDGVMVAESVTDDDPGLRIVYANPAFEDLTGYAAAEAVGQSPSILHDSGPDGADPEVIRAALRGRDPVRVEVANRRKDGTRVWAEWHVVPVPDPDGAYRHWVAVLRDTTERRKAQDEIRRTRDFLTTLLDNIPVPVHVADADDRYLLVNPAWEQAAGVSRDLAVGRTLGRLFPDPVADLFARQNKAVRTTGGPVREEVELDFGAGRRVFLTVKFPVRGPDGRAGAVGGVAVDVTERRAAEEALRRSEERFRALFDRIPHPMFVYDLGTLNYLAVNDAAVEHYGYTRDEFLRMTVKDLRPPEDVPALLDMFARSRPALEQRGVWRHRKKDGTVFDAEITAHALDVDGRPACIVLAIDVTERRRAETALRESEERFRRVFEDSPIGIYRATPDGRVVLANPAAVRMAGCATLNELAARDLGRGGADLLDGAASRDPDARGLEFAWQRSDGTVVHVRENSRAVRGPGGEVLYYEGTLEDVTDRKRAEAALREREQLLQSVIAHIPCGVFWKDRASTFLGCNDQFARDHGFASPADLIGKTDRDLPVTPAEAEGFLAYDQQVMQTGLPVLNLEEYQTRPAGRVTLLTSKVPLRDAAGAVVGVLGVYQDITELKRLEGQLRQAQKMDAVGRLAGGIAHDFNNLLTVINGYGELLRDTAAGNPEAQDLAAEVCRAGERAAALTRQLLAFSRRSVLAPVTLDLNVVVSESGRMIRRLIGEDIDLRCVLGPGPAWVRADPGHLDQVILNLVVNARDAMPDGGRVTIRTAAAEVTPADTLAHPDARPGPHVVLSVADTGCGMADEVRRHIFEPFFTTKGPGKGTGLGLATVYGIVRQSGGHIRVESAPGRGSEFAVYLPRVEPPEDARSREAGSRETRRGTETVLLAEDEDGVRGFAGVALRAAGYTVLEAADGREALQVADRHPDRIDLLVTDMVMPHLGGSGVARELTGRHPSLRVLFLSGYTEDAVVRDGALAVGSGFLQKPFTAAGLMRKVREVLDGPPPTRA